MSLFSRRSILSRFVASVPAVAIGGTVGAPALSSPSAAAISDLPAVAEQQDVLMLFQRFETALAELKDAREGKNAAEQKFFRLLPPPPPPNSCLETMISVG